LLTSIESSRVRRRKAGQPTSEASRRLRGIAAATILGRYPAFKLILIKGTRKLRTRHPGDNPGAGFLGAGHRFRLAGIAKNRC
jgi:hypothetical protein